MTELEDFLAAQRANSLTVEEQQAERLNNTFGLNLDQPKGDSEAHFSPRKTQKRNKHRSFQGTGFYGSYTRRNKHLGIPKNNANQKDCA
ncbi:hypothetical protein [Vibrio owensii]|uniref:hypothetical protein n=1 Tax=Vibrio harveyi group TaxID=717610 RepID=UPI003CC698A0